MTGNYDHLDHLVVVMLENRSFDNVLGWTYSPDNAPPWDKPKHFIPAQSPPPFDGLVKEKYWNETAAPEIAIVYASHGTSGATPFLVPTADPHELFDHMNFQQFETIKPTEGQPATMKGFIEDYAPRAKHHEAAQIMQCYSPEQVPVLTALARNYAVCDRWFGSAPCQTWPNRAFVHAGTSCGRVNNCDKNEDNCLPDPLYYHTPTIFNLLGHHGHTWKVYNDTTLMSCTRAQFIEQLFWPSLDDRFQGFDRFKKDAAGGNLPTYSFIEPSFLIEANDQHPPHHNMIAGEKFIYDIWQAVSSGPAWKSTLLVITYDEHGGCYDHCGPKWTATNPDDSTPQQPFGFNRWGPRVPTVLVSPWIEAGTVFRSASPDVEYDHTSILATLRDWLNLPTDKPLKSERVVKAPTLDCVLTRTTPRGDWPLIPPPAVRPEMYEPSDEPLTSIQKAVIAGTVLKGRDVDPAERTRILDKLFAEVKTPADAVKYFDR